MVIIRGKGDVDNTVAVTGNTSPPDAAAGTVMVRCAARASGPVDVGTAPQSEWAGLLLSPLIEIGA
ncbi:MAG: hypothetical protein JO246_03195 [Frankiaceae bacterium]|nr:hypothetical protein [Frankiaceae bacterium]